MGAVYGEIAVEGGLDLTRVGTCERYRGRPEQAVVTNQEVDASGDSGLKGAFAGIHGGSDSSYSAIVFDLEPVMSAIEIFDLCSASALITKGDDIL